MSEKRVVYGVLLSHDGLVFACLSTEQPYDIPGYGALKRRARSCSNRQVGTISVQIVDDEEFPTSQGFIVESSKHGANHRAFQEAVTSLFPDCELKTRWVTNFRQENGNLLRALLIRRGLKQD
jgi:hypothetical protein